MQFFYAVVSLFALAKAIPNAAPSDMMMELDQRQTSCCITYFCADIVHCPKSGTGPDACCYACVNVANCPPARLVKV